MGRTAGTGRAEVKSPPQRRFVCYMDATEHGRLKAVLALEGATISAWFRVVARKKIEDHKRRRKR